MLPLKGVHHLPIRHFPFCEIVHQDLILNSLLYIWTLCKNLKSNSLHFSMSSLVLSKGGKKDEGNVGLFQCPWTSETHGPSPTKKKGISPWLNMNISSLKRWSHIKYTPPRVQFGNHGAGFEREVATSIEFLDFRIFLQQMICLKGAGSYSSSIKKMYLQNLESSLQLRSTFFFPVLLFISLKLFYCYHASSCMNYSL